jgi:outer membrane receptor for ferrienterochelin and colicins
MNHVRNHSTIFPALIFIFALTFSMPSDTYAELDKNLQNIFRMSLEELMNVKIITAGKKPENVKDIPASVIIITRSDIELYGYSTLSEIIENIPGMYKVNDYGMDGHDKFGVRGFWSDISNKHLMIFVNGINQQDSHHNNFSLNKIAVPVEAIDRIEVIRGPMSVIYGSGSFFGVINIITNQIDEDNKSIVSLSLGDNNTQKISARIVESERDHTISINVGIYNSGGIDQPYNKMMAESIASAMPTTSTNDLLEVGTKYFGFHGKFKKIYTDFSFTESNNESYLFVPSFKDGTQSKYLATNSVIGFKDDFNKKISFDTKICYYTTNHKLDYDYFFEDSFNYQVLQAQAYELDFNLFYNPNPKLNISSGINYRSASDVESRIHLPSSGIQDLYNVNSETSPGESIVTRGIFSQVSYKPVDDLTLVAGLRLEQMPVYELRRIDASNSIGVPPLTWQASYSYDDIGVIPRLAAIWNINENRFMKFLYGQAISRPSFWILHAALINEIPDLEPEKIQTVELNYFTKLPFNLIINTSLFYNMLDNMIVRDHGIDSAGEYYDTYNNSGERNTVGAELTIQHNPTDRFNVELSGSYQETENANINVIPGYSPNLLLYLKAGYRIRPDMTFAFNCNYVDKMETYWSVNEQGVGNRISDESFEAYYLLNANFQVKNFFKDELTLNIKGSNILNRDIFYPPTKNNPFFTKGTMAAGSRVLVSISYKF